MMKRCKTSSPQGIAILYGLAALALLACPGEEPVAGQESSFTVPRDFHRSFLDIPWPSDIDRRDDGSLNLRAFANPTDSTTLDDYLLLAEGMHGYACNAAIYIGTGAPVDAESLPTPLQSRDDAKASVLLVDVDSQYENFGERYAVVVQLVAPGMFVPIDALAVMPVLGQPLREGHQYALVVTTQVKTESGLALRAPADLRALLAADSPEESLLQRPWTLFAGLRQYLKSQGRSVEDIAAATVFTTDRHSALLRAAAGRVATENSAQVVSLALAAGGDQHADFIAYEGEIDVAQFQQGTPPFGAYGSGYFVLDDDRTPLVQRIERMPFALTVPRGEAPREGWPLALVAHGTGGWWSSFVGDSNGRQSQFLARAGWAGLGISQPLHFGREGYAEGQEELATFNFFNPKAALGNFAQSALETLALARLLRDGFVFAPSDADEIVIAPHALGFFGHSQGGLTGTLALALDQDIGPAVLSGAGGGFASSLLYKTLPSQPSETLRTVLALPDDELIDLYHPLLTLLQTLVEPVEPLNYARQFFAREPGQRPLSVLMTSGRGDSYTPPFNHGPLALAAGFPLLEPVLDMPIGFSQLGLSAETGPVQGNLSCAGQAVSAALLQYAPPIGSEGHFVVFNNPVATEAVRAFFASALLGVPRIQP